MAPDCLIFSISSWRFGLDRSTSTYSNPFWAALRRLCCCSVSVPEKKPFSLVSLWVAIKGIFVLWTNSLKFVVTSMRSSLTSIRSALASSALLMRFSASAVVFWKNRNADSHSHLSITVSSGTETPKCLPPLAAKCTRTSSFTLSSVTGLEAFGVTRRMVSAFCSMVLIFVSSACASIRMSGRNSIFDLPTLVILTFPSLLMIKTSSPGFKFREVPSILD